MGTAVLRQHAKPRNSHHVRRLQYLEIFKGNGVEVGKFVIVPAQDPFYLMCEKQQMKSIMTSIKNTIETHFVDSETHSTVRVYVSFVDRSNQAQAPYAHFRITREE